MKNMVERLDENGVVEEDDGLWGPLVVLPGHRREKVGKEPPHPPYALIMDNLETPLATTVYKARGNASGDIVERFIKPGSSTIFGHPEYSLDGPGPSMLNIL